MCCSIKPGNLLLDAPYTPQEHALQSRPPRLRIADWGLAEHGLTPENYICKAFM